MDIHKHWITTSTGRCFEYLNLSPDTVDIRDIAHALSQLCRWCGHTRRFFSIAEHCVRGAMVAPFGFEYAFLMHDSAEAYIGDIVTPLKRMLLLAPGTVDLDMAAKVDELEDRILAAISQKYGPLTVPMPPAVKEIDIRMALTERRDLLVDSGRPWALDTAFPHLTPYDGMDLTFPWNSEQAEHFFLQAFARLAPERVRKELANVL